MHQEQAWTLGANEGSTDAAAPVDHRLQFYATEDLLTAPVVDYLLEGISQGKAGVVIAVPQHRQAFEAVLARRGGEAYQQAQVRGQLIFMDAEETLSAFMIEGKPDWERFASTMGGLVDRLRTDASGVHAYGEMVDVLWRRGDREAALELEAHWNRLRASRDFSLLCAYALSGFASAADTARFEQVCRAHSHVRSSHEAEVGSRANSDHLAVLEQKAYALESELRVRRAAEAALRDALTARERAEEELREFVEAAVVPLHWVGPDGTILWANAAEMQLLGYTPEEYIGRNIREIHADADVIADILARLSRNEKLVEQRARLRAKDGSIRHVLIDSNVYWREGKFEHTCCFTRDVTARKRAEAARDEFLAMLGHELRNPLSPIVTALHLMDLRLGDVAAKERAVIRRQTDHMIRLVNDLLDISRVTRGKVELHRVPVEVAAVVAAAIETASPSIEERHHLLDVDVAQGIVVEVDAQRLAQAMTNLLVNAAKYTAANGRISVTARREGGSVALSVTDTGAGIAKDLLPEIFEPFTQGQRSIERSQGGLGLGLAIVRNLVELHGGAVSAASDGPGCGSTFTVRLPLHAEPAAEAALPSEVRAGGCGREVLVVDDNTDAGDSLAECLRAAGHSVRVARDGPEALALAAERAPEVALLDIGLPVMDGYELARRLQELLGPGATKLVALTGYGQATDRQRSCEAGFHAHLVKPISLAELTAFLEVAVH